jgi:transposase-like protein
VLSTEAEAYRFLELLRWGDRPPPNCPHCGVPGRAYFLRPANGRNRATRTGARTPRRVWKCGACRQQFSVLAGTILQGNRVGVLTWVAVIAHLVDNPQALPRDLADRFGISRETARNMRDRLARAATADPLLAAVGRR